MRSRKVFLTIFIALVLMGLVWVGTVAAASGIPSVSEGEVELWGVIQEIGDDYLVVNGLTVTVDEATEIKEGAEHLALADLEVDWTVQVEGFLLADGTIVAEEIKVLSREPVTPSPSTTLTPTVTLTPTLTPTPTVTPTVTPVPEGAHPVALALAVFFDVFYDEVMGWHEDGIGFGNIAKAYFLADELEGEGVAVEDVLGDKLSGVGWGQIMKSLGLSPSSRDKNLGKVMSGHGDGDTDDDVLPEADDDAGKAGSSSDAVKGKDKTPPGHAKDKGKDKGKGRGRP